MELQAKFVVEMAEEMRGTPVQVRVVQGKELGQGQALYMYSTRGCLRNGDNN